MNIFSYTQRGKIQKGHAQPSLFALHGAKRGAGFSLIELMVSVSLFVVVMTASVGTLLALIDANRKAQSLKTVMNNLNFALDSMTRTIRTGTTYYCGNDVSTLPGGTQTCPTGDVGFVVFDDSSPPQRVGYRFNSGTNSIERRKQDESSWTPITAPEINVTDMRFYFTDEVGVQPFVTVAIRGKSGAQTKYESTFSIQTSMTQRVLDE